MLYLARWNGDAWRSSIRPDFHVSHLSIGSSAKALKGAPTGLRPAGKALEEVLMHCAHDRPSPTKIAGGGLLP